MNTIEQHVVPVTVHTVRRPDSDVIEVRIGITFRLVGTIEEGPFGGFNARAIGSDSTRIGIETQAEAVQHVVEGAAFLHALHTARTTEGATP